MFDGCSKSLHYVLQETCFDRLTVHISSDCVGWPVDRLQSRQQTIEETLGEAVSASAAAAIGVAVEKLADETPGNTSIYTDFTGC